MSAPVRLILRDLDRALVGAWWRHFADAEGVSVSQGDIFQGPRGPAGRIADAIVSPANSFGFMDGGIDLVYSLRFGWEMEARLRAKIDAERGGELPVGCALVVETGSPELPWLISAPTMRVPMNVAETANAYLALRAALRVAAEHEQIGSVLCPGLATMCGCMPPDRAARQMRIAWGEVCAGEGDRLGGLAGAVRRHMELVR